MMFTSTNTQEFYDVNYAWAHSSMDVLQPAVDPIGALFSQPAMVRYKYAGQASILAILHLLWPLLEDGSMFWQEWYVYQNSYIRDGPGTATMHTRHSFSPEQWFKSTVKGMTLGPRFYSSFWDFDIAPLYNVLSRSLNHMDYWPMDVVNFVGIQEWLWPCLGKLDKETLPVMLAMIQRSWKSHNVLYRVPTRFIDILSTFTRHWQPRVRL
jgi:hypothetical protein